MLPEHNAELPGAITARELRYRVNRRGFRTTTVTPRFSGATDKPSRLVREHAARHGTDKLRRRRWSVAPEI